MKIIHVFPRRTNATPTDELAFVGDPTMFAEADKVHISVTFTWDLPEAERLEKQWRHIAPVEIGGPATGQQGEDFIPGMYLKSGYVITSRGCPNRCWFCGVWKREGNAVEKRPHAPVRTDKHIRLYPRPVTRVFIRKEKGNEGNT